MVQRWRERTARELGRTPNHIYLAPHVALRGCVAHYTIWTAGSGPAPGALTLMPDASGCIVVYWDEGRFSAMLWGATTQAVTVDGATGGPPVRLFIEFLPGGLFHFAGPCQLELTDGRFPLDAVAPGFSAALFNAVERARSLTELAEYFDALLLPIMLGREPCAAARSAVWALSAARGIMSVAALSAQEHYSARHLNRVLGEYLGMGPKLFARVLRLNAAAKLLDSGMPLTALAQESGFYDQAHFIREFQSVCGVPPGFWRENSSDFYKEPLKFPGIL